MDDQSNCYFEAKKRRIRFSRRCAIFVDHPFPFPFPPLLPLVFFHAEKWIGVRRGVPFQMAYVKLSASLEGEVTVFLCFARIAWQCCTQTHRDLIKGVSASAVKIVQPFPICLFV